MQGRKISKPYFVDVPAKATYKQVGDSWQPVSQESWRGEGCDCC
jgi:hypothetical protein